MKARKSTTGSEEPRFAEVFARLRGILQPYSARLTVTEDSPQRYGLEGGLHPTHRTPMPLAWVEIGKNYVSFHHMGVYGCPKLVEKHPGLKARMQGKSCFNFTAVDEVLFAALEQ